MAAAAAVAAICLSGCGEDSATEASTSPILAHARGNDRLDEQITRLEHQLERLREADSRDRTRVQHDEEAPAPTSSTALADLDALGDRLGAEVGGTVGSASGAVLIGGDLRSGSAWSTIKVPIALRVLADAGGPDGLSPEQRDLIGRALTASDNEAAAALFDQLAGIHGGIDAAATAVTEVLREGGDETTEVSTVGRDGFSPYGQTEWALEDQHRFMSGLISGCVGSAASRGYVLDLMGQVTSDTWGLGSVDAPASWKGGWGPDPDGRYLLRQMGVVNASGRQVVVTLMVRPDDGDFAHGQTIASEVARLLVADSEDVEPSAAPAC